MDGKFLFKSQLKKFLLLINPQSKFYMIRNLQASYFNAFILKLGKDYVKTMGKKWIRVPKMLHAVYRAS